MSEFKLKGDFFNGQFHITKSASESFQKFSPANLEQKLWTFDSDDKHVEQVIESAITGFNTWRKTPFAQREAALISFKEIVEKRADEISMAIALETGKPLWESKTEANALSAKVSVTLNDSKKRIEQETIEGVLPKLNGHTVYKPLGPCAVIGPFNFPCHLANGQILSALLAGNSIIFKPSEKTMYSGQILFECLAQANFPKGVINLIQGGAKIASKLVSHPATKGIFFTGSQNVGMKILESTYKDLNKLVALELGGKNSTIIHADANLDHCEAELLRACFLTAGQRCTSTSNVFVHKSLAQEFIDRFKKLTEKIYVSHPLDEREPFMGPLIDEQAVAEYNKFNELCLKEDAEVIFEGKEIQAHFNGHYVSPSIHYKDQLSETDSFAKTEIFAPNVCFIPYENIEQAIAWSNLSDYGLAASVFTADKNIYQLCLSDIDAGIINLNRSTVGASSRLPFGGVKGSGNGKPAAVSMIDHCVEMISSLETFDCSSTLKGVKGLRD